MDVAARRLVHRIMPMAKAKKQDTEKSEKAPAAAAKKSAPAAKKAPASTVSSSSGKKPAAAAAAAKKSTKALKPAAGTPQAPLIDTNLAAQTAAAMVANRLAGTTPAAASGQQPESSSFKNLKESLSKPSAGSLGGILGTGAGGKKFTPGFGGGKHSGGPGSGGGRNQTFGADVNRAGVPRRTGGG